MKHTVDPQHELLTRLGLDDRATPEDVAEIHDELVAFLTTAPKSLRAWARTQAAAADEAFAFLTDPDASAVPGALPVPAAYPTVQPDGSATPPTRRAPSPSEPARTVATTVVAATAAEKTFEEMLAEVTPGTHRESLATPGSEPADAVDRAADAKHRGFGFPLRRAAVVGVLAVAAVGIAVGGYQLGAAPGAAAGSGAGAQASAAPQASAGIDQALVADLMAKIQADPTDADAMMRLGDAFYVAGEFEDATAWFGKILAADEKDIRARLALGAAYFNLGDMAAAETAWQTVVEQDPSNVEAHYDLGFLFLKRTPADMAGVQREWGEVVRLAPDSDVAKTVKAHLDALSSPAPSAASSAAPAATPSAAPSTAPSPAPSGSARP